MKKYIVFILIICTIFLCDLNVNADTSSPKLLTGSVVKVPKSFFGLWRVSSKLIETDSPVIFQENNIDLWNLSRVDNVITLSNPFNGANATVTVDSIDNKYIVFTKTGKYGNKILTDTVKINLSEETFEGVDLIKLETYSDVSDKIVKTETAKYSVKGEKIAGKCNLE